MESRPSLVLLGPQRFRPTVRQVLDDLDVQGPVAAISAGWQERENEQDELREHLGRETRNLELYRRHEDVVLRDREFAAALRSRQERLKELQYLYRLRLEHALAAARQMMAESDDGPFLAEHRRAAIRAVRTLDRQHVTRLRALHAEFDAEWRRDEQPLLALHRQAISALLADCPVIAVAGGNVAVLLSRMRLFGLADLAAGRLIVAWSAGAMALAERVVLFHDHPPQGAGSAEVLDVGLGLFRGLVALPHASRRLSLGDPVRVALMARRFSPATCATLDDGARLDWDGAGFTANDDTAALGKDGAMHRMARP